MKGETGGDKVRDLDRLMDSCWRIARETSESEYSWYRKGARKMEIGGDGNSVE